MRRRRKSRGGVASKFRYEEWMLRIVLCYSRGAVIVYNRVAQCTYPNEWLLLCLANPVRSPIHSLFRVVVVFCCSFNWACDEVRRIAALTLVLHWYISPSFQCIDAQEGRVRIPSMLDEALTNISPTR